MKKHKIIFTLLLGIIGVGIALAGQHNDTANCTFGSPVYQSCDLLGFAIYNQPADCVPQYQKVGTGSGDYEAWVTWTFFSTGCGKGFYDIPFYCFWLPRTLSCGALAAVKVEQPE